MIRLVACEIFSINLCNFFLYLMHKLLFEAASLENAAFLVIFRFNVFFVCFSKLNNFKEQKNIWNHFVFFIVGK